MSSFPAQSLPGLDRLLRQIAEAHASSEDEPTGAAIIASVEFLSQLPTEIHWLCTGSPLLPVVVQAIQLWGYGEPPAQATLAAFKPVLAAALARCPECAVEWHGSCRRELRRVFREVYSYDEESTAEFFLALQMWDVERVNAAFDNAMDILERIPMAWKHVEVKGPLMECLGDPELLLKEDVFLSWKKLFLGLEKLPAGVGEKWLPGAFVLLFDSDERVREFGEQMLKKRNTKLRVAEFDTELKTSLSTIILRETKKVLPSHI
jgi:SEN1 N terminal